MGQRTDSAASAFGRSSAGTAGRPTRFPSGNVLKGYCGTIGYRIERRSEGWGGTLTERFDDLARAMAGSHPRRSVLKMMGAAFAGATAATIFKPFRSDAAVCPAGAPTCGSG